MSSLHGFLSPSHLNFSLNFLFLLKKKKTARLFSIPIEIKIWYFESHFQIAKKNLFVLFELFIFFPIQWAA